MQKCAPECSVIIPVYNKWDLTRNCLASLREHSMAHDLEVVVVDNGSSDATASELVPLGKSLFGERFVPIIFSANKNFGPACNAGARAATSTLLFFLNNDTILTPNWFPPLQKALHCHENFGAVGPLLLYENGTVQHLGVTFGTIGPMHLYQDFPPDHPVVVKDRDLQCITGAALMIRADLFQDCGEFFEEYQNGFEDLDICVQLQRRGKKMRCIKESRIFHLESQTPGRKEGDDKNSILFTKRCGRDVYIDIHHHALRDGFSVFISDLLTVGFRLQEKDEQAITAKALGQEGGVWQDLRKKHPLWIKGREVLAQSLELAGRQVDALPLRGELAEIEPMLNRYRDLARLVPFAATGTTWPGTVEKHLGIIAQNKSNKIYAQATLYGARQRFKQGGDPFLEQAFEAKLKEMFPNDCG